MNERKLVRQFSLNGKHLQQYDDGSTIEFIEANKVKKYSNDYKILIGIYNELLIKEKTSELTEDEKEFLNMLKDKFNK